MQDNRGIKCTSYEFMIDEQQNIEWSTATSKNFTRILSASKIFLR